MDCHTLRTAAFPPQKKRNHRTIDGCVSLRQSRLGNCRMHVADRSSGQQKRGNSNRYTVRIEFAVTHSKQTAVVLSNRNKKPPPGGVPDLAAVGRSCAAGAIPRGREILRPPRRTQDDGRDERPASMPPVFYSTHPGSRIRACSTKMNSSYLIHSLAGDHPDLRG